jgi:predicted Zn-ribbon and HTH transcriptional regulator
MENDKSKLPSDVEWEQRTLCSDESCIGVIGPAGRCKECGLPYESEKQQVFSKEHATSDSEAVDEVAEEEEGEVDDDDEDDYEVDDDDEDAATDIEWEQRTLCRDESCIGVIGADARCKECGLP